mmetsp:Transcript_36195/g.103970  ORF Transcript_36195/g.103970 Transcript_36195/m.103970 type:complete len:218 (+) Transcript_36195:175-828(+)
MRLRQEPADGAQVSVRGEAPPEDRRRGRLRVADALRLLPGPSLGGLATGNSKGGGRGRLRHGRRYSKRSLRPLGLLQPRRWRHIRRVQRREEDLGEERPQELVIGLVGGNALTPLRQLHGPKQEPLKLRESHLHLEIIEERDQLLPRLLIRGDAPPYSPQAGRAQHLRQNLESLHEGNREVVLRQAVLDLSSALPSANAAASAAFAAIETHHGVDVR